MRKNIHNNENGMASIVIAILIIIILSTIVLGFMQIIRREERRTLDRQLSSQAFYAAESGINDAAKAINEQGFVGNKDQCAPYDMVSPTQPAALSGANTNKLTGDGSVSYTCLLIDQEPGTLEYKSIRTDHTTAFPVAGVSSSGTPVPVESVTFEWRDTDKAYDRFRPAGSTAFDTSANWNATGLLRVDIVPANQLDRASLVSRAKTYFLYPNAGGGTGSVNYSSTQSGAIVNGQCSGAGSDAMCSVTINGLTGGSVYVRMIAMYRPVGVTVSAANASGTVAGLTGAQTMVDSTGKATDVIRRIQVRIPRQNVDLPDYALSSMDSLCKRFLVLPNGVFGDGGGPECSVNQ